MNFKKYDDKFEEFKTNYEKFYSREIVKNIEKGNLEFVVSLNLTFSEAHYFELIKEYEEIKIKYIFIPEAKIISFDDWKRKKITQEIIKNTKSF